MAIHPLKTTEILVEEHAKNGLYQHCLLKGDQMKHVQLTSTLRFSKIFLITLRKTKKHLKIGLPKRKVVSQLPFFEVLLLMGTNPESAPLVAQDVVIAAQSVSLAAE